MTNPRINLLATFSILLLFLISGCSSSPNLDALPNYKEGVVDVELSLLDNAPPSEVYPGSDFKIIVRVHNILGYEITDAHLALTGWIGRYFTLPDVIRDVEGIEGTPAKLQGRSLERPNGEEAFVEFEARAGSLFLNADEQISPFIIKLAYDSTLDFSDTVCINPSLYAAYDAGCMVEARKSYNGQGAPLSVASLEEVILSGAPGNVEFRIFLKDRGNGRVKTAELVSATLGGKGLDCSFELNTGAKREFHPEDQGEALLRCRQFLDSPASYSTTLVLRLKYEYEQKLPHQLRLIQPGSLRRSGVFP